MPARSRHPLWLSCIAGNLCSQQLCRAIRTRSAWVLAQGKRSTPICLVLQWAQGKRDIHHHLSETLAGCDFSISSCRTWFDYEHAVSWSQSSHEHEASHANTHTHTQRTANTHDTRNNRLNMKHVRGRISHSTTPQNLVIPSGASTCGGVEHESSVARRDMRR